VASDVGDGEQAVELGGHRRIGDGDAPLRRRDEAGLEEREPQAAAGDARAQGEPRYVQFQPSATKGALYLPD
jgi:hypothetical protein